MITTSQQLKTKYNKYHKYRPSEIAWIGDVPLDWEMKRLKYVSRFEYGNSLPEERRNLDGDIEVYGSNGLIGYHDIAITDGNSIIIGRKGSYGKLTWVHQSCFPVDTTYFIDSRFTTNELRWLYYLLACLRLDEGSQDTGVPGLARESAYAIQVPVPSLGEQRTIADFLDRETALIDDVIAKKQKLIELLREKRQALITDAVTKGLNPNAKLKPSGIDWLGNIPEQWELLPIWMLFYRGRGRVISNEEILDHHGEFPVYSSQTENDGVLGFIDTYDFDGDYITWTTDGANAGTVFNRMGKFNCTNVCGTLKTKNLKDVDLRFFTHVLNVCSKIFVRYDINPKLMNNVIAGIRVPVPPKQTQVTICDFIDHETRQFDAVVGKIESQIAKLKEYRQALIASAVTGKIKV